MNNRIVTLTGVLADLEVIQVALVRQKKQIGETSGNLDPFIQGLQEAQGDCVTAQRNVSEGIQAVEDAQRHIRQVMEGCQQLKDLVTFAIGPVAEKTI